jgi:hypothetical protein
MRQVNWLETGFVCYVQQLKLLGKNIVPLTKYPTLVVVPSASLVQCSGCPYNQHPKDKMILMHSSISAGSIL